MTFSLLNICCRNLLSFAYLPSKSFLSMYVVMFSPLSFNFIWITPRRKWRFFSYISVAQMNMNIWNNHIFELRIKIELYEDHQIIAVKVFQLKQLKRRNLKKFRLERKSKPWPLRYRCSALTNCAIKPTGSCSIVSSYPMHKLFDKNR